ncbi:hypothetical protein [Streptomyces sp. DH10]|uniref:hypothetical protein n=1 Tax=Streptomyces sp. DH10 TaxID=3040121 RepID=UPI003FA6AB0D
MDYQRRPPRQRGHALALSVAARRLGDMGSDEEQLLCGRIYGTDPTTADHGRAAPTPNWSAAR